MGAVGSRWSRRRRRRRDARAQGLLVLAAITLMTISLVIEDGPVRTAFTQHTTHPGVRVFVLPSTSGAARGYWDIAHWHELARQAGRL